jgi:hypothetical protein
MRYLLWLFLIVSISSLNFSCQDNPIQPQTNKSSKYLIIHKNYYASDGTINGNYYYDYNSNGDMIEYLYITIDGEIIYHDRHDYQYNSLGYIIYETYSHLGSLSLSTTHIRYVYDQYNLLSDKMFYSSLDSLTGYYIYQYNNKGLKCVSNYYTASDSLVDSTTINYNSNDSIELLITYTSPNWDITYSEQSEFNGNGERIIGTVYMSGYTATATMTYDSLHRMITENVEVNNLSENYAFEYDINNNLIAEKYCPTSSIDSTCRLEYQFYYTKYTGQAINGIPDSLKQ